MLILCFALIIFCIKCDYVFVSISYYFKSFVETTKLFYCIIALTAFISIAHLVIAPKSEIAKEHLLFKRLGPILSIPLTCLTHGIFFYCGLLLIYIVCYDEGTLKKYAFLDKTTVTITMLALMTYAVYSIKLIIGDILNYNMEKAGRIISPANSEEEEESVNTPE